MLLKQVGSLQNEVNAKVFWASGRRLSNRTGLCMERRTGTSLSEYALIGGLVLVLSIGALSVLGKVTGGMFGGMLSGKPPVSQTSPATSMRTAAVSDAPSVGALASGMAAGQQKACFSSGVCIDFPSMNPATVVTSGGLGSQYTHDLASVLDQVKAQLVAENADPSVIDLVSKLANQGHDMGDYEQSMWDQMAGCMQGGVCANQKVFGSTYTMEHVMLNKVAQLKTLDAQLQTYLTAHPDALANFPEAQSIINTEVNQIATLGSNLNHGIDPVPSGQDGAFQIYPDAMTHGLVAQNASTITHASSNTICGQGGQACTK